METTEVDAFLDRYLGSAALGAPLGNAERLKELGE
uniref:SAM-dependent methyltransferase n=1 Tax=Steinernema glaseri TaxID=37863 RepID=A0A1I7Y9W5_9BILA